MLLVNNDVPVEPGFIAGCIRAVEAHPGSVLSSIIYFESDRQRAWWHSGGPRSLWVPFARQQRHFDSPAVVDVVCAVGA